MNDTQSPQAGSGKVEVTLLDILKLLPHGTQRILKAAFPLFLGDQKSFPRAVDSLKIIKEM